LHQDTLDLIVNILRQFFYHIFLGSESESTNINFLDLESNLQKELSQMQYKNPNDLEMMYKKSLAAKID